MFQLISLSPPLLRNLHNHNSLNKQIPESSLRVSAIMISETENSYWYLTPIELYLLGELNGGGMDLNNAFQLNVESVDLLCLGMKFIKEFTTYCRR